MKTATKLVHLAVRLHDGTPSSEAVTTAMRALDSIGRLLDEELDAGCPTETARQTCKEDELASEILDEFMTRYSEPIASDPKCRNFVYNQIIARAEMLH